MLDVHRTNTVSTIFGANSNIFNGLAPPPTSKSDKVYIACSGTSKAMSGRVKATSFHMVAGYKGAVGETRALLPAS